MERLQRAELIAAIASDAAASEDLDSLLRTALERLHEAIPFKGGSLALLESDGLLAMRAAVGVIDDDARKVRLSPGTGIVGTVFVSGRSFRSADLDAEVRISPAARTVGTNRLMRSFVCVPLAHRGEVFGVLELDSSQVDAFTAEDQELLETVGRMLAAVVRLTALAESEHQAVEARDDLFAAVSHDLRNPLTVVRGQAQRLLKRHLGDQDEAPLQAILTQVDRLGRMIGGLVDVARSHTEEALVLDRQPGDLTAFSVAVARTALGPDREQRLVCKSPEVAFEFDRLRVEQAVANLVDNAAKYSPSDAPIELNIQDEGSCISISVSDQGPGVPVDERAAIFDRFVRGEGSSTASGHGLGLYIVRLAAEAHGGEVEVRAREDGVAGSVFRVRFPREITSGSASAEAG